METRKNSQYLRMILGTIPGHEDKEIKGCKLPDKRQVLLCLLANLKDSSWNEALSHTIDNVQMHYERANIPTISGRNNIGTKIKEFYEDFSSLMKLNNCRRNLDNPKIKKFMSELNTTMKFYKNTILKDLEGNKNYKTVREKEMLELDIAFMKSMMSDRIASYSGIDKMATEISNKRLKRSHETATQQKTASNQSIEQLEHTLLDSTMSSDGGMDAGPSTSREELSRQHRRTKKAGVDVFIPHDILKSSELIACSLRNNISSTQLSAIVHSLILACGGDSTKVSLSSCSAWRYRTSVIPDISDKIKSEWAPSSRMTVHWDGKLMATLNSDGIDDRMPILVSGSNGIKLLGVPPLPHFTKKAGVSHGDAVSKATKALLDDWKCDQNIFAMVFDTTASNTGERLQRKICLHIKRQYFILFLIHYMLD